MQNFRLLYYKYAGTQLDNCDLFKFALKSARSSFITISQIKGVEESDLEGERENEREREKKSEAKTGGKEMAKIEERAILLSEIKIHPRMLTELLRCNCCFMFIRNQSNLTLKLLYSDKLKLTLGRSACYLCVLAICMDQ